MKNKRLILTASIAALLGLPTLAPKAAGQQFWDGPHNDNTTTEGGSGSWDIINNNWANASGVGGNVYNPALQPIFNGSGGDTVTLGSSVSLPPSGMQILGGLIFANGGEAIDLGTGSSISVPFFGVYSTIFPRLTGGSAGISFTKNGSGTLVLAGTNTYSGQTRVQDGILGVTGTLTGSSGVMVDAGASLTGGGVGGNGVIASDVTVNGSISPGRIYPPNSVGLTGFSTLTVGGLTLNSGSTAYFDLTTPGGNGDLIAVTNALTIDGATLNLAGLAVGPAGLGNYTLFTFGSLVTFNNVSVVSPVPNRTYSFSSLGNAITLQVAAAPQYWDGLGPANNGVVNGGTGDWTSTASNWTDSAGTVNSLWGDGSTVFRGPGGTVTIFGPISASGLTFETSGYSIAGSTLTLTGSSVTVNSGITATIGAPIAGSVGLAAC